MKTLAAKLLEFGAVRASDLTKYERSVIRRLGASDYMNRHGVLVVVQL